MLVIFKCRHCNTISRREIEMVGTNFVSPVTLDNRGIDARPIVLCNCGKHILGRAIQGKFNATKICNGKCMGATGHNCECSCSGANHGSNFNL